MSDLLDRRIAEIMKGPQIDVRGMFSDDELLPNLEFQLHQLSRLTTALELLFPLDVLAGEGSIDRAIRILEHFRMCEPPESVVGANRLRSHDDV